MSDRQILLINESQVKAKAFIDHNIDAKVLSRLIHLVQESHLAGVLGASLYASLLNEVKQKAEDSTYAIQPLTLQLLQDYVHPYMAFATLAEFVAVSSFNIGNKGPMKMNDTSATAPSTDEIEWVKNYYNQYAGTFKGKLIDFIKENKLVPDGEATDTNDTAQAIGWHIPNVKKNFQNSPGSASNAALSLQESDPIWTADKVNYYPKAEVDALDAALQAEIDNKSDIGHTHPIDEVNGLQTALDGKQPVGNYADLNHTHSISDITGLQSTLDAKASVIHTHAATDIVSGIMNTARMGSGTASGTTYLAGDGTWKTINLAQYLTTSTAAQTYVPYTNATGGVDLGNNFIACGSVTVGTRMWINGIVTNASNGFFGLGVYPNVTTNATVGTYYGLTVSPTFNATAASQTYYGVNIAPTFSNPSGFANVVGWALNVTGAAAISGKVYVGTTTDYSANIQTYISGTSNGVNVRSAVGATGYAYQVSIDAGNGTVAYIASNGQAYFDCGGTGAGAYGLNVKRNGIGGQSLLRVAGNGLVEIGAGATSTLSVNGNTWTAGLCVNAAGFSTPGTGYILDVIGAARIYGTLTATTASYSHVNIAPSITANQNNQTIIGLDVTSTVNALSFTGVTNYALRVTGAITQTNGTVFLNSAGTSRTIIGTNVDDGSNRLQVTGNVAITGNLSLTGSISTTNTISTGTGGTTGGERFGSGSQAGTSSTAVGSNANALSSSATSIGCSSQAVAYGSALGHLAKALGSQSISIGFDSQAINVDSVMVGSRGRVGSTNSIAIGTWSQIPSALTNAIVIGTGDNNTAGNYSTAAHNNTIVMGHKAASTAANQFMIGSASNNYNMYLNGALTATGKATVPTLKVSSLPVYADNAAALVGGLTSGDIYRTSTGDLKGVI